MLLREQEMRATQWFADEETTQNINSIRIGASFHVSHESLLPERAMFMEA